MYRESNRAVAAFPLLLFCRKGGLNESRRSGWRIEMGKDIVWINSNKRYYSTVSLRARFGVNDVDFSLFPPLLSHSCPGRRERARGTESERGRYEIDDGMMFCLAPSFGRLTTLSFAFAVVAQAKRSISLPHSARNEHWELGLCSRYGLNSAPHSGAKRRSVFHNQRTFDRNEIE